MVQIMTWQEDIDGLVQYCSNSSALAMELLQSCTKPLTLSELYDDLFLIYYPL